MGEPEELVDSGKINDSGNNAGTIDKYQDEDRITCRQDLIPYFQKIDNSINKLHCSKVPKICKEEPCQLGVDEAGRGPVLGPMSYGIAYAPLSRKQTLVDLGCADSKTLTEEQRDKIFDKICEKHEEMGWSIEAISPNVIANSMYSRSKVSLNDVSMNSAINLIKLAIDAGVNVREIYVDTVGKPEKYQAKLKAIFPDIEKITVAKKADSTYPIVSAASICAKVSRDHALRAWQFREGDYNSEYGSGYPNDPLTKKWLTENIDQVFGFPQIVRFSWSTAEKILESKALAVEWEDVEDEAESPAAPKILKFFARTPPASGKAQRSKHSFFSDRCLTNTVDL
ncbi:ribonuclease H2 subunit A [Venturia canescens]|uniref:ribonuclease H2 subunit A n=1 Tax=Venturia canescens TaxID=32260 RepID=UPI001C9C405B|nr:ribonuclease H2 subunit A [Venturia canescens]XP_043275605.1 ribonuclease H2 subunit A [Venturia canescens]